MTHALPQLPYDFSALEPHIDAKTMEVHYTKHHQTYLDKFNAAYGQLPEDLKELSVEMLLKQLSIIPENIRSAIRNNGGGYYNHSLFWTMMSPESSSPSDELQTALSSSFGGFEAFKKKFSEEAVGRFGSGWAWLVKQEDGSLVVMSTANQDNPISENPNVKPILALDVWEHAYYLKYQNRRPEYIEQWWNVVNWNEVNRLFREE
jgi:Fe-Mn family superoxide dismutase